MADESKTGILGHLPPLPRPALNNSVIGMEQAYRQRKGLTLLTDADIEALKAGQPMPWEEGGAGCPSVPAPAASAPVNSGGSTASGRTSSCSTSCRSSRRHQRRSRRVGRQGKQMEQVHDCRRTGAAWTKRPDTSE